MTTAASALAAKLSSLTERLLSEPLDPGLYIVATPIGNLGDISPRALSILARASAVYCEDTRHSRKLFSAFGIERQLLAYHDHSGERDRARILARLGEGQSVALISDAGTPLISDPGYKLVAAALEMGARVIPAPGPCAAVAALSVSALAADSFLFAGFLPPKEEARRKKLEALAVIPAALILYESAKRLEKTLNAMAPLFAGRDVAIMRELTKIHEEAVSGRFPEAAALDLSGFARGEIVILAGAPAAVKREPASGEVEAELKSALAEMSVKDAAEKVAERLGIKRKVVYDLAVRMKR